jgi:hypothetical protein
MTLKLNYLAMVLLSTLLDLTMAQTAKLMSALEQARQTQPVPTPTPTFVPRGLADKRQVSSAEASTTTFTVTVAPDSTCGFLSGSPGNPITCENGSACLWETQYIGAIFCGLGDDDPSYLACLDSEEASDPDQCDDVCQSNIFNLLCTASSAPFCRTYNYPDGVRDFRCASTRVSAVQSVSFTYNSQSDRELETSIVGSGDIDSSSDVLDELTSFTRTSETETSSTTATSTSDASSDDDDDEDDGGDSGTNIGAIVGGAVGGFAVLSLIAVAIWWFRRRSQRQKAAAGPYNGSIPVAGPTAGGPPPPMQQQQHMYPVHPGHASVSSGGYDQQQQQWKSPSPWGAPATSPVHSSPSPGPNSGYVSPTDDARYSQAYSSHTGHVSGSPPPPPPFSMANPNAQEVGTDLRGHHRGQIAEMS